MERNEITEIKNLLLGDRFYKLKDKGKTVFEKVDAKAKTTQYQTYSHFAKVSGEKFPQSFKSETAVVFLRSAAGLFLLCLSSCKDGHKAIALDHDMMVNFTSLIFFIWIGMIALFAIKHRVSSYKNKRDEY